MIATCPACSARYRVNPDNIRGRAAKITCPRCSHKFIVEKQEEGNAESDTGGEPAAQATDQPLEKERTPTQDQEPEPSDARNEPDIFDHDFRTVGITWRVQHGPDTIYSFRDLRSVVRAIEDGKIDETCRISHDSKSWTSMDEIEDLEAYFQTVWEAAKSGNPMAMPFKAADDRSTWTDEMSDSQRKSSTPPPARRVPEPEEDAEDEPTAMMMIDDIRRVVADATTPAPSPRRPSDGTARPDAYLPPYITDPTAPTRTVAPIDVGYLAPTPEPAPEREPGEHDQRRTDGAWVMPLTITVSVLMVLGAIGFSLWWVGALDPVVAPSEPTPNGPPLTEIAPELPDPGSEEPSPSAD